MKLIIEGTPKEIADLVLAVQNRLKEPKFIPVDSTNGEHLDRGEGVMHS